MGIIKRQGIKQAIISYLGVLIGLASTLWIYSLDEYIYGVARFLLSGASFIGAFAFLGVNTWVIRFFPYFKNDENKHNGFLPLVLVASMAAFALFMLLVWYFQEPLLSVLGFLDMKPELYDANFLYIAILCFLLAFSIVISSYVSNFQRIVVPELLNNLWIKISLPILILCYYFDFLYEKGFIYGFLIVHAFVLLGLILYTIYLKQWSIRLQFSFLKKDLVKDMRNYAFFNILGDIGSQLATRLDLLMIASLMPSLSSVGVYGIALNIASVVEIPYRSFSKIASPIIAQENTANNHSIVLDLYQRSSIALLVAGLLIFLGVWISVDSLFLLAGKSEVLTAGKNVILLIGIAKIIDMATGINGQIIAYSKHYRVNVIAISILAVINIFANYYFIPIYGVTGAALATLISLGTFNVFKFFYVWIVFKMQPFTWSAAIVLLLGASSFGVVSLIPLTNFPLLDIVIKSGTLGLLFSAGIIYFKVSSDISKVFFDFLEKIKNFRS